MKYEKLSSEKIRQMAVEFIEEVAALDFQDVRQMDIPTFIKKYREVYMHTLQTMDDDEIHYLALILEYLYPMVKDMLELAEKKRETNRAKEGSDIGKVLQLFKRHFSVTVLKQGLLACNIQLSVRL